jgi:FAD/FMN-containing dehydrogenase
MALSTFCRAFLPREALQSLRSRGSKRPEQGVSTCAPKLGSPIIPAQIHADRVTSYRPEAHAMTSVRNYGRTWRFVPGAVAYPSSAQEIAAIVKRAGKVRVMGSRHSWSKGIVTDGTLLSLDAMNRVVRIDSENLRVTAQAGIKLRDLIAKLERHGLALANLGSVDAQSLAGAISTGTHGTGIEFSCLASQVESLRLIDGEGQERHLDRSHPDFNAVVVGLGCFGVVHEMTLSVVPSFQLHAIAETALFDDVIEKLDAYVKEYDHFKFWWLVPSDRVIVYKHKRTDAKRSDNALRRWLNDVLLSVVVYRALVVLGMLSRRWLIPVINRLLTTLTMRWERVCRSYQGFMVPLPPIHRETEWAFDYAQARDLLRAYRELLLKSGHTYNFIQEIRFTKADGFWLSPAFGRDSIWLSMYNMDGSRHWDDQLAQFDAFARGHGGRPHWGKEASFDAAYLRTQWPAFREFRALARAYDPQGKFVNAWVEQIFRE